MTNIDPQPNPLDQARAASLAFLVALGDPTMSDRDVAFEGVMAALIAGQNQGLITDPLKLIARLKKITA